MFALISHAQGLAALQAYCHWMAQYYLETHRQQHHQEKFVALVSKAVDALVPLLNKDVSWLLIDLALNSKAKVTVGRESVRLTVSV